MRSYVDILEDLQKYSKYNIYGAYVKKNENKKKKKRLFQRSENTKIIIQNPFYLNENKIIVSLALTFTMNSRGKNYVEWNLKSINFLFYFFFKCHSF